MVPSGSERTTHRRSGIWLVLDLDPRKRGSMEQQLSALARRLQEREVPLAYVFSKPPVPWLARQLEAARVDVQTLDYKRPLASARTLYGRLVKARPALVHFHFLRASSPLVIAARLAGARVIVNDHLALRAVARSPLHAVAKRLRDAMVNPLVDLRLAVSRFVAESVAAAEHVDRARIDVVENGVDLARFARASSERVREELGVGGRPLVVCVSRLAHDKGVSTAVRALPQLPGGAVLALVGDGALRGELLALASALGVRERLRLLGLRDDVERLLAACDVSIVPSSTEEAFGQAAVESMAAGKPVVVTRSGALPDIVGDAGLVVPRDDPAALAGAIAHLLADGPQRERLGRAAQARAGRYDLSRWVARMEAVYERALRSQ